VSIEISEQLAPRVDERAQPSRRRRSRSDEGSVPRCPR
jgi:hypothetical protein